MNAPLPTQAQAMQAPLRVKTLVIDGIDVSGHEEQTILEVAREHGIHIPALCYMEGLSVVGACRLCMVEIKGSPKLVAACATRVREGIEVVTDSKRLRKYRRMVLELLFSERNHVCAVCVANGNCELQSLAQELGMDHVNVPYMYPKVGEDATHQRFAIDHNRCIMCTRCVRVCDGGRGRAHLGRQGPRHQRPRHHRPESGLGHLLDLHELRQVRAALPHGRALREGHLRGREGEARVPALSDRHAGERTMSKARVATMWLEAAPAATCPSWTWTSASSHWPSHRAGLQPAGGRQGVPRGRRRDPGQRRHRQPRATRADQDRPPAHQGAGQPGRLRRHGQRALHAQPVQGGGRCSQRAYVENASAQPAVPGPGRAAAARSTCCPCTTW